MATAILDLDLEQLPTVIGGLEGYRQALVLFRLRQQPLARGMLPVVDGRIAGAELRDLMLSEVGWSFEDPWLRIYLGLGAAPPMACKLPSATVAICTHGRPDDLHHSLEALTRLPDDGQELLVVDNRPSTEETRTLVGRYAGVRYVREDRLGLDVARNRAMREARNDVVAFLDDDAVPDPGWLRALLPSFGDPLVLCVTGLTMPLELETEAQEWFERYSGFGRGFKQRTFEWGNTNPLRAGIVGAGANMALRRTVMEQVGLFDEALDGGTPTLSGGDTEMFSRILASGYRIVYAPAALNWHRHRRTWDELRRVLYGYGVGVYAVWTKQLLFEGELTVPKLALGWFWGSQLPALLGSLLKLKGSMPADLLFAELRGCAAGPWAYLSSRRRLQQERRKGHRAARSGH